MNPEIQYRVVFDLLEVGYQHWGFALTGVVSVIAGLGLLALGRTALKNSHPLLRETIPKAVIAVTVVFTLVAFLPTFLPYRSMRSALASGEAEVLEGIVSQFEIQRTATNQPERFELAGRTFAYSDYTMTPGFHQSRARGGPLKEGLRVRLAHIGGTIVRLEVAD